MADSNSSGIGVVGAIQTVFFINKVTDAGEIADWSWWWVLSPIWISVSLTLIFLAVAGLITWAGRPRSRRR